MFSVGFSSGSAPDAGLESVDDGGVFSAVEDDGSSLTIVSRTTTGTSGQYVEAKTERVGVGEDWSTAVCRIVDALKLCVYLDGGKIFPTGTYVGCTLQGLSP